MLLLVLALLLLVSLAVVIALAVSMAAALAVVLISIGLFATVLIALATPTLLAMVAVLKTSRIPTKIEFQDTQAETLPEPVRKFVGDLVGALSDEGFTVLANRRSDSHAPAIGYTIDLVNRKNGDFATAVFSIWKQTWDDGILFSTQYPGDLTVVTVNTRVRTFLPPAPNFDALPLPQVRDAHALYHIHRLRVAMQHRGEPIVRPAGLEMENFERDRAKNLRWLVESGYFREEPDSPFFRPTLRGASMIALKMAWPGKNVRKLIHDRRARQALARLGVKRLPDGSLSVPTLR